VGEDGGETDRAGDEIADDMKREITKAGGKVGSARGLGG